MDDKEQADLHAQIMNLPCKFQAAWDAQPSEWVEGYVNGHRDTRHAAAELARASSSHREAEVKAFPVVGYVHKDWKPENGQGRIYGHCPGADYVAVCTTSREAEVKAAMRAGFMFGFKAAAVWAGRDDLIADIGSPAYEIDCDGACGALKD